MTPENANNKGTTFPSRRQVLLLNLMPTKARTFGQFSTLLNSSCDADVVHLHVETHQTRSDNGEHKKVSSISWRNVDPTLCSGLIITGAPLEHLHFHDVDYWREFEQIIKWAEKNIPRRLYICWAAQAALHLKHSLIPKHYPVKISGIIRQDVLCPSSLVTGLGSTFEAPVSRYTGITPEALANHPDIKVIATGESGDVCLASEGGDTYMMNHLEYDALSLDDEFRRDMKLERTVRIPTNYFPNNDIHSTPKNRWNKTAKTFFSNWLNSEPTKSHRNEITQPLAPLMLTPGPLPIAEEIKRQMLVDFGSRSSHIVNVTNRVRQKLLSLAGAGSKHTAIPIQGSGSFAIEASFRTFFTKESRPLVIVNGNYGERLVTMLNRQGIKPIVLRFAVDAGISLSEVKNKLASDSTISHLIFVHCETTTGIWNPYKELLALAKKYDVVSMVDSMSAFGCLPVDAQKDDFDLLISSGNKCIEAPPGIAFVIAKKQLLARCNHVCDSYCFDLIDQWREFESCGQWRTTPPVHVLQAFDAALQALESETVDKRRERYQTIADRIEIEMRTMGFTPLLSGVPSSPGCLSFRNEKWQGHEASYFQDFHAYLEQQGFHLYANMHTGTGSFRIGCMGQIKPESVECFLEVVRAYVNARQDKDTLIRPSLNNIVQSNQYNDRELDIA